MSEDRFDDGLSHFVNGSTGFGAQFVMHDFFERRLFRRAAGRHYHLSVFHAPRGYMQIDLFRAFVGNIRLAPVSGIGADVLGLATHVGFDCASIGNSCCLSLVSIVKSAATMICVWASTAICALYPCTKMPLLAPSGMIRLSGSVKLRCALGSGCACSGTGICGLRPLFFLPVFFLLGARRV